MKRSTFMLISAIYGLLLGAILVILPSEAMKNYGYPSIDVLHGDLSIHIGMLVIVIAAFLFIKRNSENQELVRVLLLMNCISSITGALYDFIIINHVTVMPTIGYFDIGLRMVIGLATVFYLRKTD